MKTNQSMNPNIIGRRLLIVTAHPDDETFLAGGTIHANKASGGTTHLVCATLGELGTAYMKNPGTALEVQQIRKEELSAVTQYLGIDKIEILDFPDGLLSEHLADLKEKIQAIANIKDFDFIISFGKDGYTGHKDHSAIGLVAKEVAKTLGIPFLEFCKPPKSVCGDMESFLKTKQKKGSYDIDHQIIEPNIHIQVDQDRKLSALRMYHSQFAGLDPYQIFPEDVAAHLLSNEYFFAEN